MTKEEAHQRMQELLTQSRALINEMAAVARVGCIERVDFMGSYIHFGKRFDAEFALNPDGSSDYTREIGGTYVPAASGPMLNDQYWSASSFDCWPTDEMRSWLFGDDPSSYRRTDYNDDRFDLGRWPKGLPPGSVPMDDDR